MKVYSLEEEYRESDLFISIVRKDYEIDMNIEI